MGNDDRFLEVLKANGLQPEVWQIDQLLELSKKTSNHIKHFNKDIEGLAAAIGDVGFKNFIFINKKGDAISAGNGRILAASRAGKTELPVLRIVDLSEAKTRKFALGDNKLRSDKWDEQVLVEDLFFIKNQNESIEYLDFGKYADQLKDDMAAEEEKIAQAIQEIDAEQGEPYRAPGGPVGGMAPDPSVIESVEADKVNLNSVYPSDNEYEIPELLLARQPIGLDTPVNRWGTSARTKRIDGGLIHFYTDDYKFSGILNDPLTVLKTGCSSIVEPNFSTNDDMRRAIVLYYIYLKRYLARTWQEYGLNVWVDLAIAPRHRELALIGVPPGWRCYATYTYTKDYDIEWLHKDFEQAVKHSGLAENEVLFYVYGGNADVEKLCKERKWLWTAAHQQAYHHNANSRR